MLHIGPLQQVSTGFVINRPCFIKSVSTAMSAKTLVGWLLCRVPQQARGWINIHHPSVTCNVYETWLSLFFFILLRTVIGEFHPLPAPFAVNTTSKMPKEYSSRTLTWPSPSGPSFLRLRFTLKNIPILPICYDWFVENESNSICKKNKTDQKTILKTPKPKP